MIKRLRLAYWAFMNPDNLTMLKFELQEDSKEGKDPLELSMAGLRYRAWWYLQYLNFGVE